MYYLIEHNGNRHHFTANKGPWKLIFVRAFDNKSDALKFERKLKSLRNKKYIQAIFRVLFRVGAHPDLSGGSLVRIQSARQVNSWNPL